MAIFSIISYFLYMIRKRWKSKIFIYKYSLMNQKLIKLDDIIENFLKRFCFNIIKNFNPLIDIFNIDNIKKIKIEV
jgi:hypothetical protein